MPTFSCIDSLGIQLENYLNQEFACEELEENKSTPVYLVRGIDLNQVNLSARNLGTYVVNFGLKQLTNSRFTVKGSSEVGVFIPNDVGESGVIKSMTLHFHKSTAVQKISDVEIDLFGFDPVMKKVLGKINTEKILYKPTNRSRKKVKIHLDSKRWKLPKNGIFVALKYVNHHAETVGPSLRLTLGSERQLTYIKSYTNPTNWYPYGLRSSSGKISNVMLDVTAIFPKSK